MAEYPMQAVSMLIFSPFWSIEPLISRLSGTNGNEYKRRVCAAPIELEVLTNKPVSDLSFTEVYTKSAGNVNLTPLQDMKLSSIKSVATEQEVEPCNSEPSIISLIATLIYIPPLSLLSVLSNVASHLIIATEAFSFLESVMRHSTKYSPRWL